MPNFSMAAKAAISVLLAVTAFASNVFVAPQGAGSVLVYNGTPLSPTGSVSTIPNPLTVIANPQGTRVYVIGRDGNVAILNASGFVELSRFSIGSSVNAAVLSPDGRRLVLAASRLFVLTVMRDDGVANDNNPPMSELDVGNQPNDVDVSLDGRTAFAISTISQTITSVDLATVTRVDQKKIDQNPNGVTVGPNGLVYVSATNRLYEIDARGGMINYTVPSGIQFAADPGKPGISPDGQRAVMLNRQASAGAAVIAVDLKTRQFTLGGSGGPYTSLRMAGPTVGYCLFDGKVYSVGTDPATLSAPLGVTNGVIGFTLSDEFPSPRAMFLLYANSVARYDLASTTTAPALTFAGAAGAISFGGPASNLAAATILNTSLDQPSAPGSQSLPIAFRTVDSNGRPLFDKQISLTSTVPGLVIADPSPRTNASGLVSTRVTLPGIAGKYAVNAGTDGATGQVVITAAGTVTTPGVTQFSVTAGNGQMISAGSVSSPFQVTLRDAAGVGIAGATVNFAVKAGVGIALTGSTAITDGNGNALTSLTAGTFTPSLLELTRPITLQASVATATFTGSVDIFAVVYPNGNLPVVQLSSILPVSSAELVLPAGSTVPKAFTAQVNASTPGLPNLAVANVGIRAYNPNPGGPAFACNANPISSAAGIVDCDLVVGTSLGPTQLQLIVGENANYIYTYNVRVTPGVPARLPIIRGNDQSGSPGTTTPLALVVEVQDSQGNPIRDVEVGWNIMSGDGQLTGTVNRSDRDGRASTLVRFGNTPGAIVVRASTASLTATFTLTNNSPVGQFTIVSGNGQAAALSTAFAAPLVVRALNPAGAPIVGAGVAFRVDSGPVTLSAPTATTNAQGDASVTVTAGATIGAARVTATLAASSVTFDLTVTPAGPRITSVVLGAGFRPGVVACSIATIRGSGFLAAPGTFSGPMVGPLPTTLGGVSVTVGNIPAPIFAVINQDGSEQINIQVPCELPVATHVLRVTSLGQSANFDLALAGVSPGIFEFTGSAGRQGVVVKSTGIFVTPETPAVHGETVTGYFTGLPVGPGQFSNQPGSGQSLPVDGIIIGLGNQGMTVLRAQYAMNLIGVYTVQFIVDASAGTGNVPYSIAAQTPSGLVYSNASILPVRAQ